MSYQKIIIDMVFACSEAGKKMAQQCAMFGDERPLYLHFKESTETEDGDLVLLKESEPQPEGFMLADCDGLMCNVPYADYFQWIHARITSLPILSPVH